MHLPIFTPRPFPALFGSGMCRRRARAAPRGALRAQPRHLEVPNEAGTVPPVQSGTCIDVRRRLGGHPRCPAAPAQMHRWFFTTAVRRARFGSSMCRRRARAAPRGALRAQPRHLEVPNEAGTVPPVQFDTCSGTGTGQRGRCPRNRVGPAGRDGRSPAAARIASAWRRLVCSSSRTRATEREPDIPATRARSADHTSAG